MAGSRKLEVQIIGDASSLSKAFGNASKSSSRFGSALGSVAKYGAFALGAAGIGGIAAVLKTGIAEFSEASKVAAQTGAVLKSTGGAAHVTAKQVSDLSEALMRKSGVDDEAIQSGQNMLLTFTKVRNEAGKGNDIFRQATQATLDMSVAMGKDMPASAILVGKALNDPLKGMTALSKAGIQFTADQKTAIAAMVESGNVMGAQKVILGELTTQFGGSAEALGKTLPGQINVLKQSFSNLSGEVVASLVPSFTKILNWTTVNWPTIEKVIKTVFTGIGTAIGVLVGFFRTHWATISAVTTAAFNTIRTVAERVWPQVQAAAVKVVAWYQGTLRPAIQNVIAALTAIWNRFGGDITRIATIAFNTARTVIVSSMRVIQGVIEAVLAAIRGDWSQVWSSLKQVVANVFIGVKAIIGGFVSIAYTLMLAVGKALIDGVIAGASGLGSRLRDALSSQIHGAISGIKGAFSIRSPSQVTADQIGKPLAEGIVQGMDGGLALLAPKMIAKIQAAVARAKAVVDAARTRLTASFSLLSDKLLRAFDAETGGHVTAAGAALDAISARRQQEDLATAVEDAQARLQNALEGGDPGEVAAAQRALYRAQEDVQAVSLEAQRAREQQAYTDQRDAMRENLAARLALLSASFAKEGATVAQSLAAIDKLMRSFGITFAESGELIGRYFVAGLQKAIGGAANATAGVRGAQTGGNANPNVTVNFPNYVGDKREIASLVNTELGKAVRRGAVLAI